MIKKKVVESLDLLILKKSFKILLLIIFVFSLFIGMNYLLNKEKREIICGDGTFDNNCSLKKPYFCLDGVLVEKASVCGCPEVLTKNEDLCISKYQTNPKNITLKYILRGEKGEIDVVVYRGLVDYLLGLPKFVYYSGEGPSRLDFKIRNINEREQRELLLPLVTEIQNIAKNKEDQARIAISLIQNIFYGEFGTFENNSKTDYSRYPYEVIYYAGGICDVRSDLLAFLLKEIGYGVVLFHYPLENHDVVGIKCPGEYSLNNTGYCFVETTGPSIITNNRNVYTGWGKLSSEPVIMFISEGESLSDDLYEYKDSKMMIEINKIIEETGNLSFIKSYKLNSLREKYGLIK